MAELSLRPNYPPNAANGGIDAGRVECDAILAEMEWRIRKEYEQAAAEMRKKAEEYLAWFEEEDKRMQKLVAQGKMTQQEYTNWRLSHIAQGRRWYEMAEVLASDLNAANVIAAEIVNGYMPEVFAVGYNTALYQGELTSGFSTSFTLYDRDTVIRLISEYPDLLPIKAHIDNVKDIEWNKKQLASAITQGILQGETMQEIADRLINSSIAQNENVAMRNARTAVTSAENGGRYEGYRRLKRAGADMTIEWCATLDGRTRHTHRILDGQRQDVDVPFEVDGYKILYAGDPRAAQGLIWNCRCTMLAWVKSFENDPDLKLQTRPDGMTYTEWKHAKEAEYEAAKERKAEKERQRARINPDNPSYGYATDIEV